MERYGISRLTEATELLYSRNGMSATQKYEAIQGIFTQLADHSKTGSRRGLRSFGEVMDDWVADLEKRFDPSGEQRGMSTVSRHSTDCWRRKVWLKALCS